MRTGPRTLIVSATLLLLASGIFSGCSGTVADPPHVADSTIVEVFIELHLAAARQSLDYAALPAERDSILARHGLDSTRFQNILDTYATQPEAYSALYATVLDRMTEERHKQGEGLPESQEVPPGVRDDWQ